MGNLIIILLGIFVFITTRLYFWVKDRKKAKHRKKIDLIVNKLMDEPEKGLAISKEDAGDVIIALRDEYTKCALGLLDASRESRYSLDRLEIIVERQKERLLDLTESINNKNK